MPFERFAETAKSYKAIVSIRSNGSIGLSSGALAKFFKDDQNLAVLFYDKETKQIGIKPVTEEEPGVHKVHRGKTGAWIGAQRFLDYFGIGTKKTVRHDAAWDDTHEMLVFALK